MQRWIRVLTVLLVLQLLVAAGLAARKGRFGAVTPDAPLLPAAIATADHIVIEARPAVGAVADSARVELLKQQDHWILPGYFNAPASGPKVADLLHRLVAVKRGLPIATSPAALQRFKVVDQDFERRLQFDQGGKLLGTLYIGSSPGLRKSDARTAQDRAVYAVDLPAYEFPAKPGDWFDGDLLKREAASIAEIEVSHGEHAGFRLVRQVAAGNSPAGWLDPALPPGEKVDPARADALANAVAQLHVDAILGTEALPAWQQDHPLLSLALKDGKGQSTAWTLSKPSSGDFYVLKSSAYPWYLSVSAFNAKPLLDASSRDALLAPAGSHG